VVPGSVRIGRPAGVLAVLLEAGEAMRDLIERVLRAIVIVVLGPRLLVAVVLVGRQVLAGIVLIAHR